MLHKNANIYVEKPVGDPKKKKNEACGILVKYKPGVNFVFFPFSLCQKASDSQTSHC